MSELDPPADPHRAAAAPPLGMARDWLEQAPVTRALLALNVGVFALELSMSHSFSPTAAVQMQLGASYALATVGEGRWETLVTACFIHRDLLHLLINGALLWLAGPLVERTVGSARMAPMYLLAGSFGFLLSVLREWLAHDPSRGSFSVGASGAIFGVFAATLVVGWRMQGWKGPVTQAMVRWLGLLVALSLLSNWLGGSTDNATHVGGVIAGGLIATQWKLRHRYPEGTTRGILFASVGVVAVSIAILSAREAASPFATMRVQDRYDFTMRAVSDGRCRDSHDGLLAVERLRGPMDSLRRQVEITCGHVMER